MLTGFDIASYRGLTKVQFQEFGKVNIFVGGNNSGKTSVLEGISLSQNFNDVEMLLDIASRRYENISIDALKSMFNIEKEEPYISIGTYNMKKELIWCIVHYSESKKIINKQLSTVFNFEFKYTISDHPRTKDIKDITHIKEKKYRYTIELISGDTGYDIKTNSVETKDIIPKTPCQYISIGRYANTDKLIKVIDELLEENRRHELFDVLKIFDDQITHFEVIGDERLIKVFRKGENKPLCINDYGNGMYKAFNIAANVLMCRNGVLLIDEIELGIHNRAMQDFIPYLLKACEMNNVQLFFTTHSLETIDTVLFSDSINTSDIVAYYMKKKDAETVVKRYDGDTLKELREDFGFDVR